MAPRFYTNPFIPDAAMVSQVSATEPHYDGLTHTKDGSYATWSRTVVYSDGSERIEEVARSPIGVLSGYYGKPNAPRAPK